MKKIKVVVVVVLFFFSSQALLNIIKLHFSYYVLYNMPLVHVNVVLSERTFNFCL